MAVDDGPTEWEEDEAPMQDAVPLGTTELEWLDDVLGARPGEAGSFLCRPSTDRPELLLPLRSAAATAGAVTRYHDARSVAERAGSVVAGASSHLGLGRYFPGERAQLGPWTIVDHLQQVLGEPELLPAITLGPRRRNRKPVLQLLRPDGVTVGFAKLGWSDLTVELVANEAHWLREIGGALPAGIVAPSLLHAGEWNGHLLVVTGPLRTTPLVRRRGLLSSSLLAALARVRAGGRREVADLAIVQSWRTDGLDEVVALDRLVDRIGDVELEIGLWHGDLTPWNTASKGRSVAVWDWEFAGDGRPLGFDRLHMRFEHHRRARRGNERLAVRRTGHEAADLLGVDQRTADAIVLLHRCELLHRERRLAGQRWEPEGLGPLDRVLVEEIGATLGRPA